MHCHQMRYFYTLTFVWRLVLANLCQCSLKWHSFAIKRNDKWHQHEEALSSPFNIFFFSWIKLDYFLFSYIFCFLSPSHRREIQALTSENYSLERQIFAYQKSISMANNIGNMARLSISSPSKPAPSIGFGSSPGSYRTLNHLGTEGNYYNSDVSSEGYYERDNAQDMGAVDIQQQQQQLSSPQQTQQSPVVNAAQSYHQQTAHYFAANFPNTGGSGPSSARQSFSGPASPHHQSHPYHHSSQQYVNQAQQPPQQQQQQYHHHQLPAIPNKLTYSTSGYMLSSPGATSPMAAMYHQQQQQQQHIDDGTDQNGGNGNGSVADDYNPFAGQYRLKV